jgi:hypothetical protein
MVENMKERGSKADTVFSVAMSLVDAEMLRRVAEAEDIPRSNLVRRWVRAEFERRFPGEKVKA